MTSRPPNRATRLIAEVANRLGIDQQKAVVVFETVLSEWHGGETLRICAAMTPPSSRIDRQRRIAVSLAAGEAVVTIARREHVSAQWVRRLRRNTAKP